MKHFLPIFIVLVLSSSACATIQGGSDRNIRLHTTPDYATATINEVQSVGANSSVELDGVGPYRITFSKDGYYSQTVIVDPSINLYFFGNLIFGPLFPIGMIVDAVTGAIHSIDEPDLRITLVKIPNPDGPVLANTEPISAQPPIQTQPLIQTVSQPMIIAEKTSDTKIIAVMPVEVAGNTELAEGIAEALTDQMRVSLASRGMRVIDRGAQERALSEIIESEKVKSYSDCVDDSCQIPLGKALAASHILRTSLSRFGKMCAMTAELIALRESVTVSANTARSDCSEEQLLDTSMNLIDGIR
jgi:TolB-like protein